MLFPDITDVIDAYIAMKGGKRKDGSLPRNPDRVSMPDPEMPPVDMPGHLAQQLVQQTTREVEQAKRQAIKVSSLPTWMQNSITEMKMEKKKP